MTPLCIPCSSFQTLTLTPRFPHYFLFKSHRPPKTLSSSSSSCSVSRLFLSSPPLSSPSDDASTTLLPFEDLAEKDWSFLDSDPTNSDQERARKVHRIILAAEIRDESKVLVSMGTVGFVDQLVESAPCRLLAVIHDSLFVLAMIKEKYDKVRCWQGEIVVVPEKFAPFDVVFVCYLPGMSVSLDQLLGLLAERCSPGARVIITYDQGREVIEKQHRQQHPDMVTSDLPDRITLEKAAADRSFQITEFVDEPTFYLAVLRYSASGTTDQ